MNLIRFLLRWSLPALLVVTLLFYASVLVPPSFFWPAIFLSYCIPAFILLNLFLTVWLALKGRWLLLYPLAGVVFALPFILESFAFHRTEPSVRPEISVLSFNAKLFRKSNTYSEFSGESIRWVVNDTSDLKCIQEFSTNNHWPNLDITGKISKKGYHSYTFRAPGSGEHNRGLAIFSKFPMIDSGIVWQDPRSLNATIYVDVVAGTDTIRIYNVHLASMQLQLHQYKFPDGYTEKLKMLASKLKDGAIRRSEQINLLIQHTATTHYPIIMCGDFNETPYSYNYHRLSTQFGNAFDDSGNGLGFTYNSKLFFLRIDHQFYSAELQSQGYRVDRQMGVSDHFPTIGLYSVK